MCISASSRVSAQACAAVACDSSHATRARSRISASSESPLFGSARAASSAARRTSTLPRSASSRRCADSETYTFGESTDRFVFVSDKTADFIAPGAWPSPRVAMTVPFSSRAPACSSCVVINLARASPETRTRMDDRQKQLVAAAEAMRTGITTQRATGAATYPQSMQPAQPQLAVAAAAPIRAFPSTIFSEPATAPADIWANTESGPSWSAGVTDRIGSTVEGTTTWFRRSWRLLAVAAGIVLLVGAVRFAWPGKTKAAPKAAASAEASKSAKESAPRATADRGAGAAADRGAGAAPNPAAVAVVTG